MWEDDRNKKGGRWLINLDKRQRHADLDKFWIETVSSILLYMSLFILVLALFLDFHVCYFDLTVYP